MPSSIAPLLCGMWVGCFLFPRTTVAEEWTRHTIDDRYRGADGVRLADVDHDGLLDVVTPWEEGGRVTVAFDRGLDATPRWEAITVGREKSVEDAVAVDLDGDGRMEVVAAAEGKAKVIRVFAQDGSPTKWRGGEIGNSRGAEMAMFALPWPSAIGNDLVVGGKGPAATISLWQPSAEAKRDDWHLWRSSKLRDVGWVMSITRSDVDGDGEQDVLFSDRKGPNRGIGWLRGQDGKPTNDARMIGGQNHEVMFLTEIDLDGDGDLDIAAAAKDAGLLLFERLDSRGTKWQQTSVSLPKTAGSGKSVAGQRTGDRLELFVACEHSARKASIVRFTWEDARRVFGTSDEFEAESPKIDFPAGVVGTKFDLIELVDMDNDGDFDLLTCEERENLGVVWYERP